MRVLVATSLTLFLLGSCASVPGTDGRFATPGQFPGRTPTIRLVELGLKAKGGSDDRMGQL